nr:methylated-DNA--[protein]-cysteine S-methyltransferase [Oscillospiraceae bacterium]
MHSAEYRSPLGTLLLQSDGEALTALSFGRGPGEASDGCAVLEQASRWLDAYFCGEAPAIEFPLSPRGTEFQKQVWQLLLEIPYGQVRTYGGLALEMARRLGKEKMSAQAVGQAVGSNPISIIVPCHRVVGAKGQLTGYAWGVERKKWLLDHEKEDGV